MEKEKVLQFLNVIRRAVDLIEQQVNGEDQSKSIKEIEQKLTLPTSKVVKTEHQIARKKHVDDLMAIDCWPEAVSNFLICNDQNHRDQINRARAVLDSILQQWNMDGSVGLDYGCGEGWIARELLSRGITESTGYDIKYHNNWNSLSECDFTCDPSTLKENHYDIIILYDVLDHCEDAMAVMDHVRKLVKPGGVVYVRCHPWLSKHGGHLYKVGLNKAYIHLFLTWQEIVDLGYTPIFTRQEKNPLEAYRWWMHNFKVLKEKIHHNAVHGFFLEPAIKELLLNELNIPEDRQKGFMHDLGIEFVDYVLTTESSIARK
jgi:SAM-dependent methyltransferase